MKPYLKHTFGKNLLLLADLKFTWNKAVYRKKRYNNRRFIEKKYLKTFGRELNLENPVTFSEKIQWIKLYYNDPLMSVCADKVAVRDFVSRKGYADIVNDCYGVYTSPDQIDLDALPDKFILKASHGCGWNLLCKDKARLKKQWWLWKKIIRQWLRQDYGIYYRELHYSRIAPRLICEKFLEPALTGGLTEYKFFCFDGSPAMVLAEEDMYGNHRKNYYDLQWNSFNIKSKTGEITGIPKPASYDLMLKIARDLSQGFPHVRIDLYEVDGKPILGEMTFTSSAGFAVYKPSDYDYMQGEWFNLPQRDSQYVMGL